MNKQLFRTSRSVIVAIFLVALVSACSSKPQVRRADPNTSRGDAVLGGYVGESDDIEAEKENKGDPLLEFQEREKARQRKEIEDLHRQQQFDREFQKKYGVPEEAAPEDE